MIKKIINLYTKYEHYLLPIAFLFGFVWDGLTLRRIDLLYENFVFLMYLFVAGASILLVNVSSRYVRLAPLAMQFVFGGLFSGFFIFYSRSASLVASWPFLLVLLFLLVGNEIFKKQYARLVFQLSIFFFALFSYSIFALPVFIGKLGAVIFLLSGVASLLLMGILVFFLNLFIPGKIHYVRRALFASVLGIYLLLNILYFTNIIPPIPLSLKEAGVYHSVERNDAGQYNVSFERGPWFSVFQKTNSVFHWVPGSPVYVYSAVFVPTKIGTTIFHRWSYFDEGKGEWAEANRIGFSISGGRDGGYRGYTVKNSVMPGKWRVDVVTERDQLLGRISFDVVEVENTPELKLSTI